MKTTALKNFQHRTKLCLAEFYPVAGIVGIAAYIFVECFLE